MTESQQLLAEYAQNGSETAFRELVDSYLDLVYSAAVRLVDGDAHRAQDVTQTVFIDLARMARTLSRNVMLGGWLHRHTCFVATNTLRSERRRQSRERQAVEMNALHDDPEINSAQIAPLLDEVVNKLDDADRTAILLRFFEQRDFRSVGEILGSTEDAARMRVTRALEKLRSLLKQRGLTTTAAALSVILTAGAVQSAPVGMAATISTAAFLTGTAVQTSTIIATGKTIAMTTLQKTIIGAALAAAIGAGIYQAHQASQLRSQIGMLQQQQAGLNDKIGQLQQERDDAVKRLAIRPVPHLPAPPLTIATNVPVDDLQTNLHDRFMDKWPKLTAQQLAAYLKANGTNSSSLLAAFRTSGDLGLLRQAMEKYPDDPKVAFEAAINKDLSPDEQRQWLNTFEQSAPNNALANYLSALNYFNSGQIDQGVQELATASGKQMDDYTLERIQDDDEAYLSAGYSTAEAETIAHQSLLIPQDSQIKQLGRDLISLANAYSQSGDQASSQATLQMAINLGQNFGSQSSSSTLLPELVGLSIQTLALNAMNPNSPYGNNGQTVQDALNQISQYRAQLNQLTQQAQPLLQTLSDQDFLNYNNRRLMFGEVTAMQWVVRKYGQQ